MQNQDPIFFIKKKWWWLWNKGGCWAAKAVCDSRRDGWGSEGIWIFCQMHPPPRLRQLRFLFIETLFFFSAGNEGKCRGHFSKSPNGHVSNVSKEVFLQKVEMSSGPYLMLLKEVLCSFTSEASLISPCPQGHSGTTTNSYWQKIFIFATSDNRNSNDHQEANIESEDVFVEIHYVDYSHFREQVPFKHLHCTE